MTRRGGLIESHAHIAQLGRSLAMVDLADCADRAEVLERLADDARSRPACGPESWVLAHGARPEGWPEPRWPTAGELERACAGRPCAVWCFDHHALAAGLTALRAAGVGPDTPDPPGGLIERGPDGAPTGLLLEHAVRLVWDAVPEPSEAARLDHIRDALASLRAHGFEEVHDLKSEPWLGPTLGELERRGELRERVLLRPLLEDLPRVLDGRARWESELVRLAGAKIFTDGTLNSRTAWMLEPYADPISGHPTGTPMMTPEAIEDAVRAVDALGLALAAHAIGDGAVRAVLDAIDRVRPRTSGFRVEHAELIDGSDVGRFASMGVVCSVQPCHLLYDIEALRRHVPGRLERVLPLRELIDSGCAPGELLVFGSDTPIVRPDPEDSVLAATTRRRRGMDAALAITPEQAIEEPEAWRAFGATGA